VPAGGPAAAARSAASVTPDRLGAGQLRPAVQPQLGQRVLQRPLHRATAGLLRPAEEVRAVVRQVEPDADEPASPVRGGGLVGSCGSYFVSGASGPGASVLSGAGASSSASTAGDSITPSSATGDSATALSTASGASTASTGSGASTGSAAG